VCLYTYCIAYAKTHLKKALPCIYSSLFTTQDAKQAAPQGVQICTRGGSIHDGVFEGIGFIFTRAFILINMPVCALCSKHAKCLSKRDRHPTDVYKLRHTYTEEHQYAIYCISRHLSHICRPVCLNREVSAVLGVMCTKTQMHPSVA
jgi:hypothetical protein